jgi:tRNA A37 threonylcarbamoyladenosine biosynthesis protein TsaE
LHNKENISIIEWPEIISKYYKPTIEIFLEKTDNENERIINIKYYK